jgi:hypothetical protein
LFELDVTLGVDVITVAVGFSRPISKQRMVVSEPHMQNASTWNVAAILSVNEQLPVASVALV